MLSNSPLSTDILLVFVIFNLFVTTQVPGMELIILHRVHGMLLVPTHERLCCLFYIAISLSYKLSPILNPILFYNHSSIFNTCHANPPSICLFTFCVCGPEIQQQHGSKSTAQMVRTYRWQDPQHTVPATPTAASSGSCSSCRKARGGGPTRQPCLVLRERSQEACIPTIKTGPGHRPGPTL